MDKDQEYYGVEGCLPLSHVLWSRWLSPTHIKSFQLTKRPDGGNQRENPGPPIPTLAECIVAHEHPKSVIRSTRNFNEKRVDPTEKKVEGLSHEKRAFAMKVIHHGLASVYHQK